MAQPDVIFTKITATPDIAVRDTSGRAAPPKQPCQLFPPVPQGGEAAKTGTLIPVAFQIPKFPTNNPVTIAIDIGIKVQFPKEWDGPQVLQLVGALKDETPLLQTIKPWETHLDKNVPTTYVQEYTFQSLQLLAPAAITSPIPFSARGVWQWSLQVPNPVAGGKPLHEITCETPPPQMKLYWINSYAPIGRSIVSSNAARPTIDLQGVWPIELLDYFVPTIKELQSMPNSAEWLKWWTDTHVQDKIRKSGAYYNAVSGVSGFGMGCCGGSFDLRQLTANDVKMCNSFDLAALLQLAMTLLPDKNGEDLFYTVWMCKAPFGFLKPSQLWNWSEDEEVGYHNVKGVVNPFFQGPVPIGVPDGDPLPANVENVVQHPKCKVHARAWLEIDNARSGHFKVYDLSLALPSADDYLPSLGTLASQDYAATVVDVSVKDDVHSESYYSNKGTFAPIVVSSAGLNGKSRVGVTSTNGAPEKMGYNDYDFFLALPDYIRTKVGLVLTRGNIKPTADVVNDASLKSQDILPFLGIPDTLKDVTPKSFELSVGRGVTRARYTKLDINLGYPFIVDIYTYVSTSSALEGLAFQISQFESDVFFSTTTPEPSQDSVETIRIKTPHGYITSLANLIITVTIRSEKRLEPREQKLALNIINSLCNHIMPRCCAQSQARKPVLLVQNKPVKDKKVKQGEEFEVIIYPRDMLAEQVEARSDNGALVMAVDAAGGGSDKVKFWTLDYGNPPNASKQVRCEVLAAHRDTFYPVRTSFEVSVAE